MFSSIRPVYSSRTLSAASSSSSPTQVSPFNTANVDATKIFKGESAKNKSKHATSLLTTSQHL